MPILMSSFLTAFVLEFLHLYELDETVDFRYLFVPNHTPNKGDVSRGWGA